MLEWPITEYVPGTDSASDPQAQQPQAQPLEELAKDDEKIHHSRSSDVERGTEGDTAPLTKQKADSKRAKKPTLDLLCGDILCQFEVGLYEYN